MNSELFKEIKEFEKDLFTEGKEKKSKIIIETQINLTSRDLKLLEEIIFLIRRGVEKYYDKLIKNIPKPITQKDLSSVVVYITDIVGENIQTSEVIGSYLDKKISIKRNIVEDFFKLINSNEFNQINFFEFTELVRVITHEYVHAIQDLNGLIDYYASLPQEFKYYDSPTEKEAVYVSTVLTEEIFRSNMIRKLINKNGYKLKKIENVKLKKREKKTIEKLVKIFEEVIFEDLKFKENEFISLCEIYTIFLEKIKESGIEYSIRDVENLFKNLRIRMYNNYHWFYKEKLGVFFSALINNKIINNNNTCYLNFEKTSPSFIGYRLSKGTVIIHGNAGDHVGSEMQDGTIVIYGNAGNFIGNGMRGGKIIIHGNAGDHVGSEMQDGTIIIYGNAGNFIGNGMRGGKIIIHGNAGDHVGFFSEKGEIQIYSSYTSIGMKCKAKIIHGNTEKYN